MKNKISSIAKLHEFYKNEFILNKISKKDIILANNKEALLFIISYCMYQGRNDTLSAKFEKIVAEYINQRWNNVLMFDQDSILLSNIKKEIKESDIELYDALKNRGLNKKNDRIMIIHLINKISTLMEFNYNLVYYIKICIENGKLIKIYSELDNIFSFGPKICSLILRDIVSVFSLEDKISKSEYYMLQPIDTWVFKISQHIGLIEEKDIDINHNKHSKLICDKCNEYKVNSIEYNQGVWYLGKHSLDIIINNLDNINYF